MRPVREWMGDKRVAAVLAGVAILFVGYRLIGAGKGPAPAVPATAVAPSPPLGRPGTGAALLGSVAAAGVVGPPDPGGMDGAGLVVEPEPVPWARRGKSVGGARRGEGERGCRLGAPRGGVVAGTEGHHRERDRVHGDLSESRT